MKTPDSYVQSAAAAIGLPIALADLPNVETDLERARVFAAHVMNFPLPSDVEAAPVFQP